MKQGDQGVKVKQLQVDLNDLLNVQLPLTSEFDGATISAVKSYQVQKHLPVTGEVDQATAQAINGDLLSKGLIKKQSASAQTSKPVEKPKESEHQPLDPNVTKAIDLLNQSLTLLKGVK